MKLLAVCLQKNPQSGMQLRHRFLDVEKETTTCYKIKTTSRSSYLVKHRTQIKKDEVDRIIIAETEKKSCWECDFGYISLYAWIVVECDEPNYDLLRYWRRQLKEKAMGELRSRNQALKSMYFELVNL